MTLFTPPCMTVREKMIFALYDWFSVTTFEAYSRGTVAEDDIERLETDYMDKLDAMGEEELWQEYRDKIGESL